MFVKFLSVVHDRKTAFPNIHFSCTKWVLFFIVGTGAAYILGLSASTDPIIAGREE
jgi:hypothetical protein